jgi:hypothetical protein
LDAESVDIWLALEGAFARGISSKRGQGGHLVNGFDV